MKGECYLLAVCPCAVLEKSMRVYRLAVCPVGLFCLVCITQDVV